MEQRNYLFIIPLSKHVDNKICLTSDGKNKCAYPCV